MLFAECYIGKLKKIVRTIVVDLPYRWPSIFLSYLDDNAVQKFRVRSTSKTEGVYRFDCNK